MSLFQKSGARKTIITIDTILNDTIFPRRAAVPLTCLNDDAEVILEVICQTMLPLKKS